jgi:hypothetical protein
MRVLLLLTSVIATGCHVELGQHTKGERGVLSFEYTSGRGCFFGCGLDKPMLRGTVETVVVTGPSALRTAKPVTAPADKVTVKEGTSGVDGNGELFRSFAVAAQDAGDVALFLVDDQSVIVDDVTLHVRDAARLTAEWTVPNPNHSPDEKDWSPSPMVTLSGNDVSVRLTAYDGTGQALQAEQGVTVTISDDNVVAIQQLASGTLWFILQPRAKGRALVSATTRSGVSTQLDVTVP